MWLVLRRNKGTGKENKKENIFLVLSILMHTFSLCSHKPLGMNKLLQLIDASAR